MSEQNSVSTKTVITGNLYQSINNLFSYINELEQANLQMQEKIKELQSNSAGSEINDK